MKKTVHQVLESYRKSCKQVYIAFNHEDQIFFDRVLVFDDNIVFLSRAGFVEKKNIKDISMIGSV